MTNRPEGHNLMYVVRRNKWSIGYIAVVTTLGFVLQVYNSVKGGS